jgi:hypothetical protein
MEQCSIYPHNVKYKMHARQVRQSAACMISDALHSGEPVKETLTHDRHPA